MFLFATTQLLCITCYLHAFNLNISKVSKVQNILLTGATGFMFLSSPSTNWMFTISHWNIWTGLRNINYLVIINIYFLILQVRSFNFLVSDSTKYKHLANQYYKACIRREAGYCKIAWSASSDPDSFKIRKVSNCQTFSSFIRKM